MGQLLLLVAFIFSWIEGVLQHLRISDPIMEPLSIKPIIQTVIEVLRRQQATNCSKLFFVA